MEEQMSQLVTGIEIVRIFIAICLLLCFYFTDLETWRGNKDPEAKLGTTLGWW